MHMAELSGSASSNDAAAPPPALCGVRVYMERSPAHTSAAWGVRFRRCPLTSGGASPSASRFLLGRFSAEATRGKDDTRGILRSTLARCEAQSRASVSMRPWCSVFC